MNICCGAKCSKRILIGIQNAVGKPLSVFDIFMSQFNFTITVSELKEQNYSYHDTYP